MKNLIKNSWKYLPIGSLANSFGEPLDTLKDYVKMPLKILAHVLYAQAAIYALAIYGCPSQNDREPSKWEVYKQTYNSVFGENGLADTNGDGRVSESEKAVVYEKLGLERKIFLQTQPLSQEELEKAKELYQDN